jgi:hypothetical protein
MYLRLWWKDARQFWPIWAFLVLAAGATQLLLNAFLGPPDRGNTRLVMAMGWACLYAFAVGAAAFAGERETGTLRLLDLLPAPRRVVWMGKVSFAIVSTTGLAAVLMAVVVINALAHPDAPAGITDGAALMMAGALIFQAMAWGLLCSAILSSALLAAVLAIVLTTLSHLATLDVRFEGPSDRLAWDLGLATAVLMASLIAFTSGRRGPRLPLDVRLRSPIEVTWAGRRPSAGKRSRASIAAAVAPAVLPAPTIAAPRPTIARSPWAADRPRPRSRMAELRSLVWQTLREGRSTWLFLLAIGLISTSPFLASTTDIDPGYLVSWNALIALAAGVSVFGLENQRRTYRFLVQHGARPGLVWLAKLATWCVGLALIWAPLIYLLATGMKVNLRQPGESIFVTLFGLHLPLVFAVAVVCGMAIPRGITAGVVALVVSLFLAAAQFGLLAIEMMPAWGVVVLPMAFLAIARAWSGDWLLDRPAPGRWVRLGLMLAVVLTTAFGGYTGWRAWSVPDVGPIPVPSDWVAASATLPDALNAAPLYREAARTSGRLRPQRASWAEVMNATIPPDLKERPEVFDLIRRASARPECQFSDPGRITLLTRLDLPPMRELAEAVLADARGRLHVGELAAAWDDLMIAFRMGRHVDQGATLMQALTSIAIERSALELAREWSNAPGQTPDRLRAAMAAYRGLPAMTPPAEVIRAEGLLVERSLDLPVEDLRDRLAEMSGASRATSTWELLRLDLIATPWERARGRRVNRKIIAEAAQLAALEPWRRPMRPGGSPIDARNLERERYSLVMVFQPHFWSYMTAEDRTEVERRALVYAMAVRAWQLRHDGRFPERLQEMVPDEWPGLPTDPYSGQPFLYMTFETASGMYPTADWPQPRWPADTRLIYSVGPNGRDDHGQPAPAGNAKDGDIVFPVLPASTGKKRR